MQAKLKNIAGIRNGYQFRGKVEPLDLEAGANMPPGVVRVIQIKDVDDDWRLHSDNLPAVRLDRAPEKYLAQQGDVLFLSRGQRLLATTITEPLHDTVATGYFFILRLKSDSVLPRYLAWAINQTPFQSVLRTFMKGTLQPLVSRKDIEDLCVEVPPLEVQEAIVAIDDLRVREQHLLAAIRSKRSQLIQAISVETARRQAQQKRTHS